jgi:hypothetical protein
MVVKTLILIDSTGSMNTCLEKTKEVALKYDTKMQKIC